MCPTSIRLNLDCFVPIDLALPMKRKQADQSFASAQALALRDHGRRRRFAFSLANHRGLSLAPRLSNGHAGRGFPLAPIRNASISDNQTHGYGTSDGDKLIHSGPPIQERIIDESKLTAPLCYRLVPESHTRCKKLTNPSPYGKRNEVALLTGAPGRRAADDVVYPNL